MAPSYAFDPAFDIDCPGWGEPWPDGEHRCSQRHDSRMCKGHSKIREEDPPFRQTGMKPCGLTPMRNGTGFCASHGGLSTKRLAKVNRASQRNKADRATTIMLHNHEALPVTDPIAEFQRMVGVLRDAFDAAGARVNELANITSVNDVGGEGLKAEVQVWERLIAHFRGALVDMSKLNLEERALKLEEARGMILAETFRWMLDEMASRGILVAERRDDARMVVGEVLTRLVQAEALPQRPDPALTIHADVYLDD
jgi:hypothetical protein